MTLLLILNPVKNVFGMMKEKQVFESKPTNEEINELLNLNTDSDSDSDSELEEENSDKENKETIHTILKNFYKNHQTANLEKEYTKIKKFEKKMTPLDQKLFEALVFSKIEDKIEKQVVLHNNYDYKETITKVATSFTNQVSNIIGNDSNEITSCFWNRTKQYISKFKNKYSYLKKLKTLNKKKKKLQILEKENCNLKKQITKSKNQFCKTLNEQLEMLITINNDQKQKLMLQSKEFQNKQNQDLNDVLRN